MNTKQDTLRDALTPDQWHLLCSLDHPERTDSMVQGPQRKRDMARLLAMGLVEVIGQERRRTDLGHNLVLDERAGLESEHGTYGQAAVAAQRQRERGHQCFPMDTAGELAD